MTTDRTIRGPGTPEAEWLESEFIANLPSVTPRALVPPAGRLVVCAPHPDDEILPCGGLLAALADRDILVIAITDGEASDPARAANLRRIRPLETQAALGRLGVDPTVERCRFPDGGLASIEGDLTAAIRRIIRPSDAVFTPWILDGHPDHEATTRAVHQATASEGCASPIEMPIWGWHWAAPSEPRLPWDRAVKVSVDGPFRAAKRLAVREFSSQLCGSPPILPPPVLARFDRPWEIFFR